jgi:hypothetical protein
VCGGECKPDSKRCTGAQNLQSETCNSGGHWVAGTTCQFVCSSGACAGVCKPQAKRCSGGAVQTCAADGSAWSDSQQCPLGCDAATTSCIACKPKTENCSNGQDDDCDGKVDCDDSDCGKGTSCGTDKVCNGGACVACRGGKSCLDEPCRTGVFNCSSGAEVCVTSNRKDLTACGSAASCGGASSKEADACMSGVCVPGKSCDYHGCDARNKCSSSCPPLTNDTGNGCEPCGHTNEPCCAFAPKECENGKLRCAHDTSISSAKICVPCGAENQRCCLPASPGDDGCDVPDDLCVAELGEPGIGECTLPR